ncbi:hypothetical protein [Microbacterium ulmi]|uniref:N-terminal half of MaoC dehydratase n=1 Tax=Microbacterium ulmi TaxID=179095 RepID=A0A7Y2LZV8_9MICO|nr:hypothetical protein [Microbacterium ulmi]NII69956.1 hypothetical protein [Microbacterium ulmi]NNH03875.1 hypothetical protein [Microbacterium ulmi]
MLDGYISDLEAGDILRPVEYELTDLIASEYAHGVEDATEFFHSPQNPLGGQVRTVTAAHVDKMRVLEESCTKERRIAGNNAPDWRIHYEFEVENFSPAFVGERLRVTGRVVDVYVKRGRRFIQFEFETSTVDGRKVSILRDRTLLRYQPETEGTAA